MGDYAMSELNEISQAIGALQADASTARSSHEELARKLDIVLERTIRISGLADTVKGHEARISLLEALKNRSLGALGMIMLGAGTIGGYITSLLSKGGHQ